MKIEYEPEIRGKCYVAKVSKKSVMEKIGEYEQIQGELKKNIIKGAFLGSGSMNDPDKNYHLEIIFSKGKYSTFVKEICEDFGLKIKEIKVGDKIQLYLKESEEISKFLALIGANQAVLKLEEIRVMKDMKNNINRKVNCETANLNKTVDAALKQIDDIELIQKKGKFEELPKQLKDVAILRLENPDWSLKDIGLKMPEMLGKSGVNRRFQKLHEIAEELRD